MSARSTDSAPQAGSELLTPEVLEQMGSLELIARTIVRGTISGSHRSPFLGSGEDFARHRAYQQGDDVRRLDWKLFARTDRLHVRLFEEASNLEALIAVDTTESMSYVGGAAVSRLRYAKFVAAALAYLMASSGDAVGLASFDDRPAFLLPPRNRTGHLHDLLLALERLTPSGSSRLSSSLDALGASLRRRGRIVVLTDCLEVDNGEQLVQSAGRLRARGDEVIVIRLLSPVELGRGQEPAARFFDPERPDTMVPGQPETDGEYTNRLNAYYARIREGLESHGAEFVEMDTSEPPARALSAWLGSRARRSAAP